jgi:hypothetical protein
MLIDLRTNRSYLLIDWNPTRLRRLVGFQIRQVAQHAKVFGDYSWSIKISPG